MEISSNVSSASMAIEKIKILGAVLELPAKQHCQSPFGPFSCWIGWVPIIHLSLFSMPPIDLTNNSSLASVRLSRNPPETFLALFFDKEMLQVC